MAKKLLTSYTFTPGAANAGTVAVSGTYALEQFLLITNVTTGATIFQFNKGTKGGAVSTGGGNTTLTLEADTSAMSANDRLQVFVDDASSGTSVTVINTVPVTGPLTDTQLRATAVPVSAASLPLPSGAATAINQSSANNSLASIDSKAPPLVSGRVPVDGSGVTQPVSAASLPLPSGAATSANQTTANTSLSSIDGKLPALSGGNVPVVPAVQLGMGVATATTQRVTLATDGAAVTSLTSIAGLAIPAHDYIALSYTGSNLTGVTYRTGGATGTIVGTLTLAYSGSNLTSVTKS